nr:MAG TPA: hypothetical protein [Bacteriophage sp.]
MICLQSHLLSIKLLSFCYLDCICIISIVFVSVKYFFIFFEISLTYDYISELI